MPYALRLAGWPDDWPVWTASCPCQPLSCAGKRRGDADERHLWPALYALVAQRRPPIIFGEQVASADGREWFAGVRADLEDLGYACGAADLCAAGVAAPHIRQRLYWAAISESGEERVRERGFSCNGEPSRMGHADGPPRLEGQRRYGHRSAEPGRQSSRPALCVVAATGYWDASQPIYCRDGKWRRIPLEPRLQPLAPRLSNRMGVLRGAGNAICAPLAAEFIRAVMEIL